MTMNIHSDAVPLRVTPEGDVRIGGTRVLLDLVIHALDDGATPETVVQRYPALELADVYAVMAYCSAARQVRTTTSVHASGGPRGSGKRSRRIKAQ